MQGDNGLFALYTPSGDLDLYNSMRWGGNGKTSQWQLAHCGWPVAICRPGSAKGVQAVVKFFSENCKAIEGLTLAIACGRHGHTSMPNNALVLYMSGMKEVKVDTTAMTVTAQ